MSKSNWYICIRLCIPETFLQKPPFFYKNRGEGKVFVDFLGGKIRNVVLDEENKSGLLTKVCRLFVDFFEASEECCWGRLFLKPLFVDFLGCFQESLQKFAHRKVVQEKSGIEKFYKKNPSGEKKKVIIK